MQMKMCSESADDWPMYANLQIWRSLVHPTPITQHCGIKKFNRLKLLARAMAKCYLLIATCDLFTWSWFKGQSQSAVTYQ